MLKIVQRSYNKIPGSTKPPRSGDRRYKLCPGGIYGSYRKDARINFREGSFDWKLKVLVHFLKLRRDQRASSPLPYALCFSITSDKSFEIANKKLRVDRAPESPGAGVVRPWGHIYGSYRRDARKNFRGGSFDWKLKIIFHFLRVKRDQRASSPPPHSLSSPSPSNQNFLDSYFSDNKKSGVNKTPQGPGAGIVSFSQ